MMHFIKGLENAGRDLTVDSFVKGMEQIKDWTPEGVGAPVTYGHNRRHGVNGSSMGHAEGGKIKVLTDYTIYKPRFKLYFCGITSHELARSLTLKNWIV